MNKFYEQNTSRVTGCKWILHPVLLDKPINLTPLTKWFGIWRKYAYSWSLRDLDQKIDATLVCYWSSNLNLTEQTSAICLEKASWSECCCSNVELPTPGIDLSTSATRKTILNTVSWSFCLHKVGGTGESPLIGSSFQRIWGTAGFVCCFWVVFFFSFFFEQ